MLAVLPSRAQLDAVTELGLARRERKNYVRKRLARVKCGEVQVKTKKTKGNRSSNLTTLLFASAILRLKKKRARMSQAARDGLIQARFF